MYLSAGSAYVFLVVVAIVLAAPYDRSITPALGKREIGGSDDVDDEVVSPSDVPSQQPDSKYGRENLLDPASQELSVVENGEKNGTNGGDGSNYNDDDDNDDDEEIRIMKERIEAWNNIPPLPPDLLDAVDYHTRLEVLSLVRAMSTYGRADFEVVFRTMRAFRPFISRGRAKIIIENTIIQAEMAKRNRLSVDVLLEEKLAALDIDELEEQMQAMVRFRRKHEGEPDPSVDNFNSELPPPLHMLTSGQDRMLVIAKARAGLVDLELLKEYILGQDPYLIDRQAAIIIREALNSFSTIVANFQALVAKPSAFQRIGNWFNSAFGRGENKG